MSGFRPVLTEYIQEKDCHTLSFYRSIGGYTALEKVLKLSLGAFLRVSVR